uniref:Uncharacterized protein n=1 Tax=Leersia perrieri TaxID=77586 RepID=A0A0D9XT27_9ORYZ
MVLPDDACNKETTQIAPLLSVLESEQGGYQPHRLVRLDKQSFTNILEIYFVDGRRILSNLSELKSLIRAGADPDYDGRSPLHLAACKGFEDVVNEGVDIDLADKFGNTPLLEAVKQGHDRVAMLLLDAAKADELSKFLDRTEEIRDKMHLWRCSVFPYHP